MFERVRRALLRTAAQIVAAHTRIYECLCMPGRLHSKEPRAGPKPIAQSVLTMLVTAWRGLCMEPAL